MNSHPESPSPPCKKIKLECSPTPSSETVHETSKEETALEAESLTGSDHCSICLHSFVDRTVIPTCAHEFCFECVLVWSEQSRRCPLCSQSMGGHLIHHIRSKYDYQKYYLTPLRSSPLPLQPLRRSQVGRAGTRRREREWGGRRVQEQADQLDRAIARRRWIYDHDLYAKHVASNSYTRYRPYPTPAQLSASTELISRMTTFLRRELRVWVNLDVEFLTTFILSIMKSIDIRSESAIKLLAEFLDMDAYVEGGRHVNAEHFAHEVYCYLRSPFRDLFVYDTVVQYDTPADIPPPPDIQSSNRWHTSNSGSPGRSPPRPRSRIRSRSRSESGSWSPSGRRREKADTSQIELVHGREREMGELTRRRAEIEQSRQLGRDDRRVAVSRRRGRKRHLQGRHRSRSHSSDGKGVGIETSLSIHDESRGMDAKKEEPWEGSKGRRRGEGDRGDKDSKGKRKADIVDDDSEGESGQQRSGSAKLGRGGSPDLNLELVRKEEPSPSQAQNPNHNHNPRKPLRNQNLLQSVQAHLGAGYIRHHPQANHIDADNDAPSAQKLQGHVQEQSHHISSAPALLSRLSSPDRQTSVILVDSEGNKVKSLLSTVNSGSSSATRTRSPAHEITVQTRARLVKSKELGQPVSLRASMINGFPASLICGRTRDGLGSDPCDAGTPVLLGSKEHLCPRPDPGLSASHDHDVNTGGNGVPVTACADFVSGRRTLDLHTRLLNKLEEEKRWSSDARREAGADVAIATVSGRKGSVGIGPSAGVRDSADAQALEARLRVRAQLRVRLAAEKKGSLAVGTGIPL